MAETFWAVFSALLAANLLTVLFVWACVNISRKEERKEPFGTYLIAFLMPLAFLLLGLMTALDASPVWLDTILQ